MTDTLTDNLAETLREVSSCYESLYLLLDTEREQFLSFDAEGLVRTVEEKAALLERLQRAERPLLEQKTELTKLWNLADETIGLEELLDQVPPDSSGKLGVGRFHQKGQI